MEKQTILDDIEKALLIEAESAKFAIVSSSILNEFMSDKDTPVASSTDSTSPQIQKNIIHSAANNFTQNENSQLKQPEPVKEVYVQSVTDEAIRTMDMEMLYTSGKSCNRCKCCISKNKLVFGAGNLNADLMFIGEYPSIDDDQQGVPFVGKTGDLLTKMINAIDICLFKLATLISTSIKFRDKIILMKIN